MASGEVLLDDSNPKDQTVDERDEKTSLPPDASTNIQQPTVSARAAQAPVAMPTGSLSPGTQHMTRQASRRRLAVKTLVMVESALAHAGQWRQYQPVIVWSDSSCFSRFLDSRFSVAYVSALMVIAASSFSVVILNTDESQIGVATVAMIIYAASVVPLYLAALSFMDSVLVSRVLRSSFDFYVVLLAQLVNTGVDLLLFFEQDDGPSALRIVVRLAVVVFATPAVVLFMLLADGAPVLPARLRHVIIHVLWVWYIFYLSGLAFGYAVPYENDSVLCLDVDKEVCQSARGAVRTAVAQLLLFFTKFVWRLHKHPGCGVLLRANITISSKQDGGSQGTVALV